MSLQHTRITDWRGEKGDLGGGGEGCEQSLQETPDNGSGVEGREPGTVSILFQQIPDTAGGWGGWKFGRHVP